jgi:6-phosphogluconolactonase
MKTSIQLAGIFATALVLTISSCKKDDSSSQSTAATNAQTEERPSPAISTRGYVYTESNATDVNAVFVYAQQADGSLKFQSAAKTTGTGTGTSLGSQGAVVLDKSHTWLYAVNAGDNSISTFRVIRGGNLSFVGKISSYGVMPVSIATYNNLVYVLNAGSDNIQGFYAGVDGPASSNLVPIGGSNQKLSSSGAAAAQISFSPNGSYLYVTEKMTNRISTFKIDEKGKAWAAFVNNSLGKTPFGFVFANEGAMVVADAANDIVGAASVTSFLGANTGSLIPTTNPVANNQTSSCWVATTSFGRYVYVTNTHSNTISVYSIGSYGRAALLFPEIPGGLAPTDIVVDATDRYVFCISSTAHTIQQFLRRADGFIANIIPDGGGMIGLPEAATGLATFTPGVSLETLQNK